MLGKKSGREGRAPFVIVTNSQPGAAGGFEMFVNSRSNVAVRLAVA